MEHNYSERDPWVAAYEERRSRESSYLEGWGLHPIADVPVMPACDEYREAARDRLREMVSGHDPLTDIEARKAHDEHEARRKSAQLAVKLAERLGEPVDPDIRRMAATPSAQPSVDAILSARAQARVDALREANHPITGHDDGSFVQRFGGDPYGLQLAGREMLGHYQQVQRHQAMAEGSKAGDLRLRRRGWRR